ncbi:MAG: NADPH-dependent F420 reductase [Longispora sp.]|nr:NADPH-dependent F420 reductase [Longispora sp. (in: high G+C Gram-positive bacteria)]
MDITFIGSGNMARGIGTRLAVPGNVLRILDRNPDKAKALASDLSASGQATVIAEQLAPEQIDGEVVILAVPYRAIAEITEEYSERLNGRIVIDICIPVNYETFDELVTPADSSAAEEIARKLPGARVVKAFNTVFSPTLRTGSVGGEKLDIFIAGDDSAANDIVSELVTEGGMRPIVTGPLRRARQLEAMGFLHMVIQKPLHKEFGTALKVLS